MENESEAVAYLPAPAGLVIAEACGDGPGQIEARCLPVLMTKVDAEGEAWALADGTWYHQDHHSRVHYRTDSCHGDWAEVDDLDCCRHALLRSGEVRNLHRSWEDRREEAAENHADLQEYKAALARRAS